MTNSRRKGKCGELEACKEINRLFNASARRTQQYAGNDGTGDVTGLHGIHVEVKRTNKFSLYKALAQAEADAEQGQVPMVMHRADRQPWVCVIRMDDLKRFALRMRRYLDDI